jgi:hypothetical protein
MIKNSKGMGLVFWIIIIMVVLLVGATFIIYLQVQGQKLMLKGAQVGEQMGIATHILPKDQYVVWVSDAFRGELTLTVKDTKGTDNTSDDMYVTDFSTTTGYQVYDTGVQTTVNYIDAFPVAYIAAVVDYNSPKANELLTNLSKLNLANANIEVIPIDLAPAQSDFQKPKDIPTNKILVSPANYWGALAVAWQSLPTVPARRDIGPNFLGIVLVSDGRCDAGADICNNQTLINQALGIAQGNAMVAAAVAGQGQNEHFYLLAPSCNLPTTKGANYKQDNLNATLSSYGDLDRVGCYTTVNRLYHDLLSDADTIKVGYEPKFVAANISAAQYHNITVKVTKRTGVLGAESAYSGTTTVKTSDEY